MPRSKPTPLAVVEDQRAIYIDFEGREKDPPTFLGALCVEDGSQDFVQYVIDQVLWPAAGAKDSDTEVAVGVPTVDLEDL